MSFWDYISTTPRRLKNDTLLADSAKEASRKTAKGIMPRAYVVRLPAHRAYVLLRMLMMP
jgi:hypothetical protein